MQNILQSIGSRHWTIWRWTMSQRRSCYDFCHVTLTGKCTFMQLDYMSYWLLRHSFLFPPFMFIFFLLQSAGLGLLLSNKRRCHVSMEVVQSATYVCRFSLQKLLNEAFRIVYTLILLSFSLIFFGIAMLYPDRSGTRDNDTGSFFLHVSPFVKLRTFMVATIHFFQLHIRCMLAEIPKCVHHLSLFTWFTYDGVTYRSALSLCHCVHWVTSLAVVLSLHPEQPMGVRTYMRTP